MNTEKLTETVVSAQMLYDIREKVKKAYGKNYTTIIAPCRKTIERIMQRGHCSIYAAIVILSKAREYKYASLAKQGWFLAAAADIIEETK